MWGVRGLVTHILTYPSWPACKDAWEARLCPSLSSGVAIKHRCQVLPSSTGVSCCHQAQVSAHTLSRGGLWPMAEAWLPSCSAPACTAACTSGASPAAVAALLAS